MSAFASRLAGLGLLLASSGAEAEIRFCNAFETTIFVAIAYPQADDSWLSRGWLELEKGDCAPFDTALNLSTFYYRAESDTYRGKDGKRHKYAWGEKGQRDFATWEDDNFNYWNAERKVMKSTLRGYIKGPEATGGPVSATITFQEGSVITSF